MESTNVVHKGNTLKANILVTYKSDTTYSAETSPEYLISGLAVIQLKVVTVKYSGYDYSHQVFLRFIKRLIDEDCSYTIKVTIIELGLRNQFFTSDNGIWHLIYEQRRQTSNAFMKFTVAVQMEVAPSTISFASLLEDTVLTDFELRGEDGSVHMHRAVLAAASPVLRRMLGGEWRETAEGRIHVAGTSTATLQNFKDYVYLRTLPESGLEELLLLSSYYMMPDLEHRCVYNLMHNLSEANACDMIEFAIKHKLQRLLLATLQHVQNGTVSVVNMYDDFTRTNTECSIEQKEI